MRRYHSNPIAEQFTNQDPILGPFYARLDIDDKYYVKNLISHFPRPVQLILIDNYENQPTRFLANTYIRETTNKLNELVPKILVQHFNSSEQELRTLAKECSSRCRYFQRMTLNAESSKPVNGNTGSEISNLNPVYGNFPYTGGLNEELQLKVYKKCASYVNDKGMPIPEPNKRSPIIGCIRRMQDEGWWLRKLRRRIVSAREGVMIYLNKVNRRKGIYCSDLTVFHRKMQKEQQLESMSRTYVTNELGDEFTLLELYEKNVSNPINRRNELMTRMSGLEKLSKELDHQGLFVTMTCPSKYHRSYSLTGDCNPKWNGSTPNDSQQYLCTVWTRIRAELDRRSIRIYGMRVAEPQHDGTPHWHLMLFANPEHIDELQDVFTLYCLEEDGEEAGAQENRVKYVDIDPAKGSATGYIAKYICKNIDGADLDEGVYGEDPIETAQRVEAWSSCWGIRQFQQIGGVSVTVWREIRRLKTLVKPDIELRALFNAADSGDWALFTQLMGGVFCKRAEQTIRPHYEIEVDHDSGLVKSGWFDGVPILKLRGIVHKGIELITRIHKWRVEYRFEKTENAFSPLLGVL